MPEGTELFRPHPKDSKRNAAERYEEQGGKDPSCSPLVETLQRERSGFFFAEDDRRDQVTADYEEDVHPYEPAGEERNSRVEKNHGDHGNGAEPIDLWT